MNRTSASYAVALFTAAIAATVSFEQYRVKGRANKSRASGPLRLKPRRRARQHPRRRRRQPHRRRPTRRLVASRRETSPPGDATRRRPRPRARPRTASALYHGHDCRLVEARHPIDRSHRLRARHSQRQLRAAKRAVHHLGGRPDATAAGFSDARYPRRARSNPRRRASLVHSARRVWNQIRVDHRRHTEMGIGAL